MKRIYKYTVSNTDVQIITLPEGAQILTVQYLNGHAVLWAIVDVEAIEQRRFKHVSIRMYATGQEMELGDEWKYISTIQMFNGDLVFHVFIQDIN